MDIFNHKKIKALEEENKRLSGELERMGQLTQPTVIYDRRNGIPLVCKVSLAKDGNNIPIEVVKREMCRKFADLIFEKDLVEFEVIDDPRTRSHILWGRVDITKRG